jgi:hypothetical protein
MPGVRWAVYACGTRSNLKPRPLAETYQEAPRPREACWQSHAGKTNAIGAFLGRKAAHQASSGRGTVCLDPPSIALPAPVGNPDASNLNCQIVRFHDLKPVPLRARCERDRPFVSNPNPRVSKAFTSQPCAASAITLSTGDVSGRGPGFRAPWPFRLHP